MLAIIRVRGKIGINKDIEDTIQMLNLTRANHCVIKKESETLKGMLYKAKDYLTWGEIDSKTLKRLLEKRAKVYKEDKLLDFNDVYKTDDVLNDVLEGKKSFKDLNLKPVVRLKPPSKGYDRAGIKKSFTVGGALGYRKEKINDLLNKML